MPLPAQRRIIVSPPAGLPPHIPVLLPLRPWLHHLHESAGHRGLEHVNSTPSSRLSAQTLQSEPVSWEPAPEDCPVDCFFVHRTSAIYTLNGTTFLLCALPHSRTGNYTLQDEQQDQRIVDELRTDASVFAGACRVYAPYYRQVCSDMHAHTQCS